MTAMRVSDFIAALSPPQRADASGFPALEARLEELGKQARERWPTVSEPAELARVLGDCVAESGADLEQGLRRLRVDDLYLARACSDGDEAAIAIFERDYLSQVPHFVAKLRLSPIELDELLQRLRTQLFVEEAARRRGIQGYRGRGALGAWLRAVAVKNALKMVGRERGALGADEALEALAGPDDDPELAQLKSSCRSEFKAAFAAALDGLRVRERNLLRQHFIDELTIDDLGRLYGVHRSTAARWLAASKQALNRAVRGELSRRLGVTADDLDDIVSLVESAIDLSLSRVL